MRGRAGGLARLVGAQLRHPSGLAGRLALEEGTVDRLPFSDAAFDRVVSVNTVYFWPDLDRGLRELRRVLAPGGRLVLGYATPEAMAAMPFTAHGFRLYGAEEIEAMLRNAGFDTPVSRIHGRSAGTFVVTETVSPRPASDGVPPVPSTSPLGDSP